MTVLFWITFFLGITSAVAGELSFREYKRSWKRMSVLFAMGACISAAVLLAIAGLIAMGVWK